MENINNNEHQRRIQALEKIAGINLTDENLAEKVEKVIASLTPEEREQFEKEQKENSK